MKNFIEHYLKIKNYTITYFTNGKNNITCLVESDNLKIIIQKESINFPKNQKFLIDMLIKKSKNTDLNLAQNYLDTRFIEFKGSYFQIMQNVKSAKINDENFIKEATNENIINCFKYLAKFHHFSEKLEIPEDKRNIGKTFKSVGEYFEMAEKLNISQNGNKSNYNDYFKKIKKLKQDTIKNCIIELGKNNFQSGIIHGDTAFKNMLFDKNINPISLIDYEKVEYNNFLWDISDLARSLLKLDKFDNNLFKICISEYCRIKNIPQIEKKEVINYLITLIFHVILQYFLALFPGSGVENKIGDELNTIKKLERGFGELNKIKNWII